MPRLGPDPGSGPGRGHGTVLGLGLDVVMAPVGLVVAGGRWVSRWVSRWALYGSGGWSTCGTSGVGGFVGSVGPAKLEPLRSSTCDIFHSVYGTRGMGHLCGRPSLSVLPLRHLPFGRKVHVHARSQALVSIGRR